MHLSPNEKDKLPLSRGLLWIGISVILITGSAVFGWIYYLHVQKSRAIDDKYLIKAIIQTGPVKEALRTVYLAELLGLSLDKPTNLFQFDIKQAEKQLLSSPVIKTATVKRVPPDILYIDYSVRQPIAMLYDYFNSAIDEEGYIFPIQPFFTPKRLPEVYLGLPAREVQDGNTPIREWNVCIQGKEIKLALSIFSMLEQEKYCSCFKLLRLDVANAYAASYGRKEIVLVVEDRKEEAGKTYLFPRLLRLSTDRYENDLNHYLALRGKLADYTIKKHIASEMDQSVIKTAGIIIDLRIPQLAFLKE